MSVVTRYLGCDIGVQYYYTNVSKVDQKRINYNRNEKYDVMVVSKLGPSQE